MGGAACGGVHASKCRHVAGMSHFAISVPDTSARTNDAGQRYERRRFCSEDEAEVRNGFQFAEVEYLRLHRC